MSGRRRKALKASFIKKFGRAPYATGWAGRRVAQPDELRQLKKLYIRTRGVV